MSAWNNKENSPASAIEAQGEKHILVVEDDKELLSSVMSILKLGGYIAMGVSSVREATFKLKNQKYLCVILDLKLGEESGLEVVDFMRTRKELPNHQTPILVASGNINPEAAKVLAGNIQGAIIKPFDMPILLDRLRKIIS